MSGGVPARIGAALLPALLTALAGGLLIAFMVSRTTSMFFAADA